MHFVLKITDLILEEIMLYMFVVSFAFIVLLTFLKLDINIILTWKNVRIDWRL